MSEARPVRIAKAELAAFGRALLEAAGATPENAAIVVDHLLEADAMGLKSHGIMRVPQYLDDIAAGGIVPRAAPTVDTADAGPRRLRRQQGLRPGGRHGDGGGGRAPCQQHRRRLRHRPPHGPHRADRRLSGGDRPPPAASASSSAAGRGPATSWRRSAGAKAASRPTRSPMPYPVAGEPPVVADFSTSVVPEGVVRSLKNRGLPAPDGALRDAAGRRPPTRARSTRRRAAPSSRSAAPSAIAAPRSPSWSTCSPRCSPTTMPTTRVREGSNLAMLAIALDDGFAGRARGWPIISAPRRRSIRRDPVMMPGEREQREMAAPATAPILVDGPTWAAMLRPEPVIGIAAPDGPRTTSEIVLTRSESGRYGSNRQSIGVKGIAGRGRPAWCAAKAASGSSRERSNDTA